MQSPTVPMTTGLGFQAVTGSSIHLAVLVVAIVLRQIIVLPMPLRATVRILSLIIIASIPPPLVVQTCGLAAHLMVMAVGMFPSIPPFPVNATMLNMIPHVIGVMVIGGLGELMFGAILKRTVVPDEIIR